MDQNQPNVDNDLQKAIDDITNTTNVDPVFSDPVAAPSSIPEGDTGELGESIGPFPEPKVEMVPPAPEPIAPLESMNIPEFGVPETITPGNVPTMPPTMPQATPPSIPTPEIPPIPEAPAPEPQINEASTTPEGLSMHQVKEAALRDLVPLLDHLSMSPSQKFNIYRNMFEELKDYTVLEPAYRAASEITNDQERAESLLYLVEAIDKM